MKRIVIIRRKQTPAERKMILEWTQGHCAYCGCNIAVKTMQIDHVVPLHNGGEDTFENMLPACRSCNHRKATLLLEEFRKSIERLPFVLNRDSVSYRNAVRFGVVVPGKKKVVFYFEIHPIKIKRGVY